MKDIRKYNVFSLMYDKFETNEIREYFKDMVQEIPDYIFTMPSSTSGKHHNKTQCQIYGQIYHIYMFWEILNYRLDLKYNREKYDNPYIRDCMRCIPAFHDAIKCGFTGSKYTVFEHPILAMEWVLNAYTDHSIEQRYKNIIANLCASHSGEWCVKTYTNKNGSLKDVSMLPEPKNDMEFFIHECDILSSRNNIDLLEIQNITKLCEDNFPLIDVPDNSHIINNTNNTKQISLDDYTIPFGKYKGLRLSDIPMDYLIWLSKKDLHEPLKSLLNTFLERKCEYEQ